MNKLKKEKGITLVALIITIIILLILAVVAIREITGNGIIAKAKEARTSYETEQRRENTILADYEDEIESAVSNGGSTPTTPSEPEETGPWEVQEDGETIKNGKTGDTIKIGDEISNDEVLAALGIEKTEYTGTYGNKTGETWTVLGVEKGRIKLVSTKDVARDVTLGKEDPNAPADLQEIYNKTGEDNLDVEKAIWSYQHAVETLNGHAKTATGIASAESIDIQDIYDIIGEENVNKGEEYKWLTNYYYNYYYETSCIFIRKKEKESDPWITNSSFIRRASGIFINKKGEIVILDSTDNGEGVTLENTSYSSYTLSPEQKAKVGSLASGYYWLASPCVGSGNGEAYFRVRYVSGGSINYNGLFDSKGGADSDSCGVRAVVYI